MSTLDLDCLRRANRARLPQFRDGNGRLCHNAIGSDWSPAQWLQALIGELGEFANVRKKYERGDLTHDEYVQKAGRELADVQTYLDLLAFRAMDTRDGLPHPIGFDLSQWTALKFNEVSARVNSTVVLVETERGFWVPAEAPRKP